MKINEYILRITGNINIPKELELSRRYKVKTEIDIQSVDERDNNDGTVNIHYRGKQTGVAEILSEGRAVIKAKDKGSMSKKLHGAFWHFSNEQRLTEDFDDYYERQMKKIIVYLPEIITFIDTRSN